MNVYVILSVTQSTACLIDEPNALNLLLSSTKNKKDQIVQGYSTMRLSGNSKKVSRLALVTTRDDKGVQIDK